MHFFVSCEIGVVNKQLLSRRSWSKPFLKNRVSQFNTSQKVCFQMACLLSTYWAVLSLSHAVKHKKPWLINITVYFKIPRKQQKILNWNNKTWGIQRAFWTWFLKFLSPTSTLCYNSCSRFPKLVRSLFINSGSFFALSLWALPGIFWRTQFHSTYNESNSFPGFLNTSLVFAIFYMYIKLNTSFIRTSLPLCHSFIQRSLPSPLLLCSPTKTPKPLFVPPLKKKHNERHCVWIKWDTNLPRGWQTTAGFIGHGFKTYFMSIKKKKN